MFRYKLFKPFTKFDNMKRTCALIFLITITIISAEDKSNDIFGFESAVPMPSLYNYRLNPLARASSPNVDQKFSHLNEIFPDSQIYYYRMPVVSPYMYVSDFGGYVESSQPYLSFPPSTVPIQLPLPFIANGKPTTIHKFPSEPHYSKPKPEVKPENQNSNVFNLNKGPYFLNGKATDIYLLQDTFSSFNGNPLNSFYP